MNETNRDFMTVLLKYGMMFAVIFAVIFLLAVLTPWMAKQVDKIIARIKNKPQAEEDPRCAQVRGIYDMPRADQNDSSDEAADQIDKEKDHETHTM